MVALREVAVRLTRVVSAAALAAMFGGALACVVEREPSAPKRLLRDVMAEKARTPPAPALPGAPATPDAATPPAASAVVDPATPVMPAALAAEPEATASVPGPVPDAFRACKVDSDCVAVLRNGCCRDGLQEAVNQASVDLYKASFTCPTKRPICPMHLVLDRRTPACDVASHQCIMIQPP